MLYLKQIKRKNLPFQLHDQTVSKKIDFTDFCCKKKTEIYDVKQLVHRSDADFSGTASAFVKQQNRTMYIFPAIISKFPTFQHHNVATLSCH